MGPDPGHDRALFFPDPDPKHEELVGLGVDGGRNDFSHPQFNFLEVFNGNHARDFSRKPLDNELVTSIFFSLIFAGFVLISAARVL